MERRDAACLHADANGYCRLITADVRSTVETLTACQAVMERMVRCHGGRVVDTAGDSLLAEFTGVAAAVWCAVDIQRALQAHNDTLPADRRLEFRVGIDAGEVLAVSGRIYGDCVNIAARVQQLATPGSICLAGSAFDLIDDTVPLGFQYLGERAVKNIDSPVRLYRVDWAEPARRPAPPTTALSRRATDHAMATNPRAGHAS